MRRLLTVAVVAVTVLLGAACSNERADLPDVAESGVTSPAGGSAVASTPPADPGADSVTASVPAGGNAAEVCTAAQKASSVAVTTFVGELAKMLEAASTGDSQAAQAARQRAEAALDRWAAAMREQAAKATDPRLKAALTAVATEVGRMDADLESIDEAKLDELQRRLDQLCSG